MFPQQTEAETKYLKLEDSLKQMNILIDEFELQFYLGKSDAISELEKQLKGFNGLINDIKAKIAGTHFADKKRASEIMTELEELQYQISFGQASTKNRLMEEAESFEQALKSVEQLLETEKANIADFHILSETYDQKTSRLQNILEIVKLQYALGKAELRDFIEDNKSELTKKLDGMKTLFNSKIEIDSKVWKEFKNEAAKIYSYLKDEIDKLK